MKHTRRADGTAAVADDMPPAVRVIALLIEHANDRLDAGLALPCPCGECAGHRESIVCTYSATDGSLVIGERA